MTTNVIIGLCFSSVYAVGVIAGTILYRPLKRWIAPGDDAVTMGVIALWPLAVALTALYYLCNGTWLYVIEPVQTWADATVTEDVSGLLRPVGNEPASPTE